MSGDLFLNCDKELQRLEGLLRTLRNYNLAFSEHKTAEVNGKKSETFYMVTLTYTKHDGTSRYIPGIDGDSFPDLFSKISDKIF